MDITESGICLLIFLTHFGLKRMPEDRGGMEVEGRRKWDGEDYRVPVKI